MEHVRKWVWGCQTNKEKVVPSLVYATSNLRRIYVESTSNLRRIYVESTSNLRRTYVEATSKLHRTYIEPTSNLRPQDIDPVSMLWKSTQRYSLNNESSIVCWRWSFV